MKLLYKLAKAAADPQALSFAQCKKTNIAVCGRDFLELDGCLCIQTYLPEQISVKTAEGILTVTGSELGLKIYHGNHAAIIGKIKSLLFEEECEC